MLDYINFRNERELWHLVLRQKDDMFLIRIFDNRHHHRKSLNCNLCIPNMRVLKK